MKIGIISALAMTTSLIATPLTSADDLTEALLAAFSSNPELAAQRSALDATAEGVKRARSGFFPSVNGQSSYSWASSKTGPTGYSPYIQSKSYSVSASQNIFSGFTTKNAVKAAKETLSAAEAQYRNTEQRIYLETVTAYLNVLRDEAVLNLNENQVRVLKRQYQAAKDRFQVGEITRTDVAQSQARLAGAETQTAIARANLAASRASYEQVVGRAPGTLVNPEVLPELPPTLDEAISIGLAQNPLVHAARANEKAADYSVKQAKGGLLPSLSADIGWSRRENDGQFFAGQQFPSSITQTKSGGLTLSVPLYAGGARYSDIRRAKKVRSQRMHEIYAAERQVQSQVTQAWDQLLAARSSITSTKSQVSANTIALDGVRQEAAVGSRTTLDVLDAEQELLNSEVNLVRAERDKFVAAYNLLSTMGYLTFGDPE